MLPAAPFPSMGAVPIFVAIVAEPIPATTPFRVPVSALSFIPFVAVFPLPCPGSAVPMLTAGLSLVPFLGLSG
jgi:hypothetical protein